MALKNNLRILKCTNCGSDRLLQQKKDELRCPQCNQIYPVRQNVVFMITKDRDTDTLRKFEHQWKVWGDEDTIFGKDVDELEKRYFAEFANPKITKQWLKGKRVLDAGCGHGMMVQVFGRLGANSIGLELGDGIMKASKRLHGADALLIQGDILDIPFRPGTFDYIHSNGVIHHTHDTRLAFKKLALTVKPGGKLDIWLYPKKGIVWETTMKTARAVTTRLPPRLLSSIAYVLVPLLFFVPTWSRTHPRTHTWKQCAQVIYDWLSPKYQTHHTYEEVKKWYEEEGFTDIGQIKTTPLAMYGTKKQ